MDKDSRVAVVTHVANWALILAVLAAFASGVKNRPVAFLAAVMISGIVLALSLNVGGTIHFARRPPLKRLCIQWMIVQVLFQLMLGAYWGWAWYFGS
jgi:hypothetical protein